MKVLLVQAYLGRKEPHGNIFPIGLCYIATPLTMKGYDVRVVDPNIFENPYEDLAAEVKSFKPNIVGISLRNIDTTMKRDIFYYYKTIKPTIQLIKETDPHVKIMIGGSGYSMFAREIMEKVPDIDFGIYLEGDETTPELLSNLENPESVKGIFFRKDGKVLFTGDRAFPDITKLPMARRDFLDIKKYFDPREDNIGIQTKRGCPLKCAYCSYPFLNGTKSRLRTPESVVDEIEYLVDKFDIHKFMFLDSIFNIPTGHAESICKEIIRRDLQKKIKWSAWLELKTFSEELMVLAKEAGCYKMSFSPDAASDESLKALGKSLREEDINRAIKIAKKSKGVVFGFGFFCTPPNQDFLGFLKTIKIYIMVHLRLLGRGGASLGWIRVEPETRMHDIAIQEGMLTKNDDLLPDDEKGLERLFYSCPNTRWYADPVFMMLTGTIDTVKPLLRKVLKRKKRI